MKNMMNCTRTVRWKGWIHPILQNGPIVQIACLARNWIQFSHQTASNDLVATMHMYICTFTGTSHGSIFVSYRQCNTFHFRLNITNDNSNDKTSNLVVSKLRFRNASEGLSSHISRIFFAKRWCIKMLKFIRRKPL